LLAGVNTTQTPEVAEMITPGPEAAGTKKCLRVLAGTFKYCWEPKLQLRSR
jgi:hypothetical protein